MSPAVESDLLHEFGFQAHGAETVDLAIDVMVAVDQADVLHLGAHLDHAARAFQFLVHDDRDGVAILQHIAGRIPIHAALGFGRLRLLCGPFMPAFRAHIQNSVFVSESGLALRAGG